MIVTPNDITRECGTRTPMANVPRLDTHRNQISGTQEMMDWAKLNWMWLAGGTVAIVVLMSMMGGRKKVTIS